MEEVGEGLEYDNTEEIVYTFPNQWTIRRITSDNDLAAEGNKMGHCVASYCEKVHLGTSLIFSLRDPRNRPHATIEMLEGGRIRQIQGKGNKLPIEKYRKMIGKWLRHVGAYIEKYVHPSLVIEGRVEDFPERIRQAYSVLKEDVDPDYGVKRVAVVREHPRDPKGFENALYYHIVHYFRNWIDRTGEGAGAVTQWPDRAKAMLEVIDLLAPKVSPELIGKDYIAPIPDRKKFEDFAGTHQSWTMYEDEGELLDKYRELDFDVLGRTHAGQEFRSLLKMESLPSWLFKWGMAEAVGLPVHRSFRSWLKRKIAEWE
jgi:hypothetical protein